MKKMTEKQIEIFKTLVMWALILVSFGIVCIILVLWASGLRYNFKANKWQKTGLVYLDCEPDSVDIYVDKNLVKTKTPSSIKLIPGEYQIIIKENNYTNWQENVQIEAGKVKKFENIILFRSNPEQTEIDKKISQFQNSPDREKIIYLSQKLYLYNLKSKSTKELNIIPKNLKIIEWSNNSSQLLIHNNKTYYIYNLENNIFTNLKKIKNPLKISFQPTDSNILIYQTNKILYNYNLNTKITKILINNIENFFISENNIIYIIKEKNDYNLYKANFSFRTKQQLAKLKNPKYKIYAKNSFIALLDENKNLYFLTNSKLRKINSNVKILNWSEILKYFGLIKKSRLLYQTVLDELYSFDPEKNENILVYRASQPIIKIDWYLSLNHIVFNTNDELKIIEINGKNENTFAKSREFEIISDKEILFLDPDYTLKIVNIR